MDPIPIVIAIPSYQRPKQLRDKTLTYLKSQNIDKNLIHVFVVEEEKEIYEKTLDPNTYGRLLVGRKGLAEQRNFIMNYFPLGQQILYLDDDIKGVKMIHPMPLMDLANKMFQLCKQEKASLWGIYPTNNLFYCKDRITVGKLYIVGCLYGEVNNQRYIPDVSACEDRWRSLNSFTLDLKVLRYEAACPDTTYYCKGGLTEYRLTKQKEDTVAVCECFPNLCYLQEKKHGLYECQWRSLVLSKLPTL
jgi:hypothetical protein